MGEPAGDQPAGDDPPGDDPPAITLLVDLPRLEQQMLGHMYGKDPIGKLESLAWEECGAKVLLPNYQGNVQSQRTALAGVTPVRLVELVRDPSKVADRLVIEEDQKVDREARDGYALQLLCMAVVVALHQEGWRIRTSPGEPVILEKEGRQIAPFELIGKLKDGKLSSLEWTSIVSDAGIGGKDLGGIS
jgi:hypothetical protein